VPEVSAAIACDCVELSTQSPAAVQFPTDEHDTPLRESLGLAPALIREDLGA
jgi:hypothetical protein